MSARRAFSRFAFFRAMACSLASFSAFFLRTMAAMPKAFLSSRRLFVSAPARSLRMKHWSVVDALVRIASLISFASSLQVERRLLAMTALSEAQRMALMTAMARSCWILSVRSFAATASAYLLSASRASFANCDALCNNSLRLCSRIMRAVVFASTQRQNLAMVSDARSCLIIFLSNTPLQRAWIARQASLS